MGVKPLLFVDAVQSVEGARAGLIGIPYDGTASYRPGSRFGPGALRAASDSIETYDPTLDSDILELGPYVDFGDVEVDSRSPENALNSIRGELAKLPGNLPLLGLGGEHSVTLPLFERALAQHLDLFHIVLDAHADLRDEYDESRYSHASVTRRIMDLVGPERIAMLGVRSGLREEFELMRNQRMIFPASAEGMEQVISQVGSAPIYISVDVGGFDPALLPGTGTVEPGGFDWQQFEDMTSLLKGRRVVGADVVELAPEYDPTGRSSVIAARIARTLLALLLEAPR